MQPHLLESRLANTAYECSAWKVHTQLDNEISFELKQSLG
jgi:hypothetical protein